MKDRIQKLIESKNISPSQFAELIGVQRSNISHILSGRNKPSFDFIQKVLSTFNNLSTDWFILGKGEMYIKKEKIVQKQILPEEETKDKKIDLDKTIPEKEIFKDVNIEKTPKVKKKKIKKKKKEIIKPKKEEKSSIFPFGNKDKNIKTIFVFYTDNSFEEFLPMKK